MDKTQLVYRDPDDLQLHRLLKQIPEPDKKSPEWGSFVESIRASGILEPLLITPDSLVMGGGRRLRAAQQIEMEEVPCLVRPEAEAGVIVVDALMQCRHMTRGAAVYLSLTLLDDFIKSANSRRLANLSKWGKSNQKPLKSPMSSNSTSEETILDFCNDRGIGRDTFYQAVEVLELFRGEKCEKLAGLFQSSGQKVPGLEALRALQAQLRKEFEPKLIDGDRNLWNIKSAVGSKIATEDKEFPQMELRFAKTVSDLAEFRSIEEARRGVHRAIGNIHDEDKLERLFQLATVIKEEASKRAKELSGRVTT